MPFNKGRMILKKRYLCDHERLGCIGLTVQNGLGVGFPGVYGCSTCKKSHGSSERHHEHHLRRMNWSMMPTTVALLTTLIGCL